MACLFSSYMRFFKGGGAEEGAMSVDKMYQLGWEPPNNRLTGIVDIKSSGKVWPVSTPELVQCRVLCLVWYFGLRILPWLSKEIAGQSNDLLGAQWGISHGECELHLLSSWRLKN